MIVDAHCSALNKVTAAQFETNVKHDRRVIATFVTFVA